MSSPLTASRSSTSCLKRGRNAPGLIRRECCGPHCVLELKSCQQIWENNLGFGFQTTNGNRDGKWPRRKESLHRCTAHGCRTDPKNNSVGGNRNGQIGKRKEWEFQLISGKGWNSWPHGLLGNPQLSWEPHDLVFRRNVLSAGSRAVSFKRGWGKRIVKPTGISTDWCSLWPLAPLPPTQAKLQVVLNVRLLM